MPDRNRKEMLPPEMLDPNRPQRVTLAGQGGAGIPQVDPAAVAAAVGRGGGGNIESIIGAMPQRNQYRTPEEYLSALQNWYDLRDQYWAMEYRGGMKTDEYGRPYHPSERAGDRGGPRLPEPMYQGPGPVGRPGVQYEGRGQQGGGPVGSRPAGARTQSRGPAPAPAGGRPSRRDQFLADMLTRQVVRKNPDMVPGVSPFVQPGIGGPEQQRAWANYAGQMHDLDKRDMFLAELAKAIGGGGG